jgi:mono/diheme cytochrome c family protein
MPAFGNTLNAAQISNVSAWVAELARRAEGGAGAE